MSFNCMNINNSLLKIIESGNPGDLMTGLDGFPKKDILFKDQLAGLLQDSQFKTGDLNNSNAILDKLVSLTSKELQGLKGAEFLKKLKELFMMISGNDLSNLTMDEKGLDFLKELLVNAGFGIDQINGLIEDLEITDTDKSVAIDKLMNKLSGLLDELNSDDEIEISEESTFLPISAIAFIESILISLNIPENNRNNILSDVKSDQGIDLNILIKNLRKFEEKSFASQTFYKIDIRNNSTAKLMNQLNFGNSGGFAFGAESFTEDKLSLQGFINILENRKKELLSLQMNQNGKFENILIKRTNADGKEILFSNPIRALKSEIDSKDIFLRSGLKSTGQDSGEKIFGLADNILRKNKAIKAAIPTKGKKIILPGADQKVVTLESVQKIVTPDVSQKVIAQDVSQKNVIPKSGLKNTLLIPGLSLTESLTEEEKKISGLVDNLLKSLTKQEISNDKIINVPLNKFSSKDFEKFFLVHDKGENGKDVQLTVKSALEEKFARLIGKLESNMSDMNGKNDSESKNFLQKERQQLSGFKLSDSSQIGNGEGKVLNSVRYLSSAKKEAGRSLPLYVTNQIGRGIARAVNSGQNEIRIQLKPPELGRMMITIEDLGNGVKVSVIAENQAAKDILLTNVNNLKDALASSGISLENFDVDMGSDFNRSMADTRQQAGYSKNKQGRKNQRIDGENENIGNKDLLRKKYLSHDGVLYYVA